MLVKELIEILKGIDGNKGVILVSNGSMSCLQKAMEDSDTIFLEGDITKVRGENND